MTPRNIAVGLYRHYEATQKIEAYYGLLAVWALTEMAYETKDDALLTECRDYLALYPDNFPHPHYNFENYRVGGPGKAWLCMKGLYDEGKEDLRKYAELTMNAPADDEGILCLVTDKRKTWIDIAFCVPHFMLCAGLALGEEKYIDWGAEQCFKMYERFLDRTTGLLHQSRGFIPAHPERISADHWSRGNGWGYVGLAALVEHLPADSRHREKAECYFKSLSEAILAHRNAHGVWGQNISTPDAWDESSGSALFLYCFGLGMRFGLLDRERYDAPFREGLQALVDRFINPDFSTEMCCEGCLCPGTGEEKGSPRAYLTDVYPKHDDEHSFGALMMAMLEAHRNGITDLHGKRWPKRVC